LSNRARWKRFVRRSARRRFMMLHGTPEFARKNSSRYPAARESARRSPLRYRDTAASTSRSSASDSFRSLIRQGPGRDRNNPRISNRRAAARQGRIEPTRQSRLLDHLGIARAKMAQRRQGKLGRERQRSDRRARADRAVVGSIGHAARGIAEKTRSLPSIFSVLKPGPSFAVMPQQSLP